MYYIPGIGAFLRYLFFRRSRLVGGCWGTGTSLYLCYQDVVDQRLKSFASTSTVVVNNGIGVSSLKSILTIAGNNVEISCLQKPGGRSKSYDKMMLNLDVRTNLSKSR
jgi:hypothetical protein